VARKGRFGDGASDRRVRAGATQLRDIVLQQVQYPLRLFLKTRPSGVHHIPPRFVTGGAGDGETCFRLCVDCDRAWKNHSARLGRLSGVERRAYPLQDPRWRQLVLARPGNLRHPPARCTRRRESVAPSLVVSSGRGSVL
jgi:hypothetical protein